MKKHSIILVLLALVLNVKPQAIIITNTSAPQPTINPNNCQGMGFDDLPVGSYSALPGWTLSGGTYTNFQFSANCLNYPTSNSIIPLMGITSTPFAFSTPSIIPVSPFAGNQALSIQPPFISMGFGLAERSFSITSSNKFLEYAYIFTISRNIENCCEAAYFKITLFDNANNPIPCASVTIVGTNQTYSACLHPSAIPTLTNVVTTWSPNWILNSFDLSSYIGTNVKLRIDVGNCTAGAHYPKLWFDAACSPSVIQPKCNNNGITTLSTYAVNSCTWNGPPTSTITNNTNASISTSVAGVYSLTIFNPNCGGTTTHTFQVNNCANTTGIKKENEESSFSIYPNPSNGNVFIKANKNLELRLIDVSGREMREINLNAGNNYTESVSDLTKGIYFIIGEATRQKIIIYDE